MNLPPARPRPKFATWRYDRNLALRATADLLEQIAGFRVCSHETVRAICLPFDDPERCEPDFALAAAIEELTAGDITAADFTQALKAVA